MTFTRIMRIPLHATAFSDGQPGVGGQVLTTVANPGISAWRLPTGVDSFISAGVPAWDLMSHDAHNPGKWEGEIIGMKIDYTVTGTASTDATDDNINLYTLCQTKAVGATIINAPTLQETGFQTPHTSLTRETYTVQYAAPVAFVQDDWMGVMINRIGTHASDDHPGHIAVLAVGIMLQE